MHIPTSQLDGLYAHRIGPTLLSHISFVSYPSESSYISRARSNLTLGIQQDTGRWSSEYSYSVGDGMFGARFMHNFGQFQGGVSQNQQQQQQQRQKRVDEEESLGKGLRGRFSAGAEIFFSALEKSGGGKQEGASGSDLRLTQYLFSTPSINRDPFHDCSRPSLALYVSGRRCRHDNLTATHSHYSYLQSCRWRNLDRLCCQGNSRFGSL
jgi:hypothetical protein